MAEMSSKGTLARAEYTYESLRMTRASRKSEGDFVIGFIAMRRFDEDPIATREQENADEDFLILTPGVAMDTKGDSLGQQYRTPRQVILESGCDVIIVGRGIYASGDIVEMRRQAEQYRTAGWNAYLERIGH